MVNLANNFKRVDNKELDITSFTDEDGLVFDVETEDLKSFIHRKYDYDQRKINLVVSKIGEL